MKSRMILILMAFIVTLIACGCGSKQGVKTGFLSDYSRLQKGSQYSMSYVDENALIRYSAFIIEPVQLHLYHGSGATDQLTEQQISDLTGYMHDKLVEAIQNAGKTVAYHPAPGVARMRIALTELRKSDTVSMIPQASLLGVGIGGASVEAEIIDSMNSRQIGALVESAEGSRIPFSNLGDWTAAKSTMDAWAQRFSGLLQSKAQ